MRSRGLACDDPAHRAPPRPPRPPRGRGPRAVESAPDVAWARPASAAPPPSPRAASPCLRATRASPRCASGVHGVGGEDGPVVDAANSLRSRRSAVARGQDGHPVVGLDLEGRGDRLVRLVERAPLHVDARHPERNRARSRGTRRRALEPGPAVLAARLRVHREEPRGGVRCFRLGGRGALLALEQDLLRPALHRAGRSRRACGTAARGRDAGAPPRAARGRRGARGESARASVEASFIGTLPDG